MPSPTHLYPLRSHNPRSISGLFSPSLPSSPSSLKKGVINQDFGLAPRILQAQAPLPTSRKGLPGRRQPAGGRGCDLLSTKPLAILTPKTNLGLTVTANPTFFFYAPRTSATVARFVLVDEENANRVYEKTFAISTTPGIVSLRLSADKSLPSLKLGKNYHWYISILCESQDRSGDIYVDGWVQRVELLPSLASQLEKASLNKRVALYQKNELWYDALTTLAQERRLHPRDSAIAAEWATLLRSEGLDEIAQEPIVESVHD
ncbi:MAG TPA: DUF928 domain-containing protein [Waterburya sp.]